MLRTKLEQVFLEIQNAVMPAGQTLFRVKAYLAGGCIASLVLDEEPADYDVWFEDIESWEQITGLMKIPPFRKSKYSWSYTLDSGKKIQLVKSRVGSPEKVTGTFDFKHTQAFYSRDKLVYDEEFIKSKQLWFVKGNLCHPVNTFQRVLKFSRRGYSVNDRTICDLMNEAGQQYTDAAFDTGSDYNDCEDDVWEWFVPNYDKDGSR